uniref:Phosphatidylinositol transfer protein membrane associated 2 n=1 Tax=Scophthalmus maximus TaxID=52904 RepID=A0A8D3BZF7_SCOMX
MLIKEYRIPMPMSVEEYRIAQLYMIQKKSREESCGEGSGVEILENKPYEDGPGGLGQYTHKVYHIGKHIPSWFCAILPQAALRVEEESWNAYPYTRTRYTCPFVEKFSIDIETYYKPDTGNQGDVFNMCSAEKRQRTVDTIDIVKDYIAPHEYLVEEDPKLYQSVKTKRGPLSEDWIEEINQNPGQDPVMCAYKLCKVEFRYWGMQSKIERFIHDVGLRKVMVRAHRQAWCWQDEWYGLTIEDIRQLELETQLALAKKMAQYSLSEEGGAETNGSSVSQDQEPGSETTGAVAEVEGGGGKMGDSLETRGELTKQWSTSSRSSNRSSKRGGSPSHQSISEWRMQSIARDSEDSTDDEFFDAHEDFSDNEEMFAKVITKWSSNDLMDKIDTIDADEAQGSRPSVFYYRMLFQIEQGTSSCTLVKETLDMCSCLSSGEQNSKQGDVNTLSGAFENVMRVHYPAALGRIAIRMVPCPAVCVDAFSLVSNLSPYSYDESCLSSSQDHIPLAALPLLATSAPQYQDAVATVILRANQVYSDFIKSSEGASFNGQVCVIGDCVGSILGFDALCSSSVTVSESQSSSRRGSAISVQVSKRPDNVLSVLFPSLSLRTQTFSLRVLEAAISAAATSTSLAGGSLGKFDFEVTDFFLFGSPLGLVLALRKTVVPSLDVSSLHPACQQVYNLFHPADPSASRLEPLLDKRFYLLPPLSVPRYQRFPLGDGHSALLGESMHHHTCYCNAAISTPHVGVFIVYELSLYMYLHPFASRWWGSKRMDYALYCPDALTAFPTVALPHLFHASYWESTDVVSFLLRQVILELNGKEVSEFTPSKPREKWFRKRTHVKIRNVTANHRVNDAVFAEDGAQMVMGRFMYGPLDMVTLTGEKIDIHIMTQPPSGEWVYFDTELTNSSGRVSYVIPESKRLGIGVYPVKMVVRGDHTFADSYITILPRGTEFVVFSIDGSFAASVSIMGSDPKVRAGAVDVVRYWQDLGYLIVYVTGRPDMQKQRVVAWLSQHNFPHGIVSFCDGLVHDPLRHKANFLKYLINKVRQAVESYGSTKDISVYTSVGLPPFHIYIVGRPTKKMQNQCQFISDGYASHLSQLEYNQRSRPAKSASTRMVLRKGSFGLGAAGGEFLRKRNHIFRTISSQPGGVGSASPNQPGRTERTQSQCEMERERGVTTATQRSMSIAAGCWGRSGSTKEGSGGLLSPK